MEIKLWDAERSKYVEVENVYIKISTLEICSIANNFKYGLDLEPHFYLNGERVA